MPPAAAIHRRPFAPDVRRVPAISDEQVVPYDYGATFQIAGTPGAIRQDVINVSPDAVFVAVAIGYGFEEERSRPLLMDVQSRVAPPGRAVRRGATNLTNVVLPAGLALPINAG